MSVDERGRSAASAVSDAVARAGPRPPVSYVRRRAAVRRSAVVVAAVAAIAVPLAATTLFRQTTLAPRLGAVTGALNPGGDTDAIGLVGGQLWVQQRGLNRLARLDQGTGLPVATTKLNGREVVSFSAGAIWLVDKTRNEITRVDAHSGRARERIVYAAANTRPTVVAVDPAGTSVWLGDQSDLVRRVDLRTKATIATFPVGSVGSIEVGSSTLLVKARGSDAGFSIVGAKAGAVLLPVSYEETAATYVDGTYFVGILDGRDYSLLRINESTLTLKRTDLPNVARSIAVTDSAVWVGMDNQTLARVDPRTGHVRYTWRLAHGPDAASPVAASDGVVYVRSGDRIVRLDPHARIQRNGG